MCIFINSNAFRVKILKIDTVHNLVYLKGSLPGVDHAYVRIKDAIRKSWHGKVFPEGATVPFPTEMKSGAELPRELVYVPKEGGVDPFSRQLRERT